MAPVPGPPPPPPPAPPAPVPPKESKLQETGQTETKRLTKEDFLTEINELITSSRGRFRSITEARDGIGDGDNNEVILAVVMPLQTAILQNGPMCGIVALAEALEVLNQHKRTENRDAAPICSKRILDKAIETGITKQGEMFSVRAMKSLAEQFGASQDLSKIASVPKDQDKDKNAILDQLVEDIVCHLITGYPVLFPYDADHNHTPSRRKGHAAHWAIVHGLVCCIPRNQMPSITDINTSFKILQSTQNLVIMKPVDTKWTTLSTSCNNNCEADFDDNHAIKLVSRLFTYENTHVLSHQGKSFRSALWKLVDLLESNQNLLEVSPKILAQKEDFVLHEGIEEGLCSQILLLN